ncbi:hypothetical protein BDW66DRAFT_145550 [Aspergillus desertorum]
MDDPLLHAWTTQYTNSPITSSLPTAPRERRLRSPSDEFVEENPNPRQYSPTPPYTLMPHAVSCEPKEGMCSLGPGNGALEYIDPSLLLLPREQTGTQFDSNADARLPGQERRTQYPCTRPNTPDMEEDFRAPGPDRRSPQPGHNEREKQSDPPVDIFKGILAKCWRLMLLGRSLPTGLAMASLRVRWRRNKRSSSRICNQCWLVQHILPRLHTGGVWLREEYGRDGDRWAFLRLGRCLKIGFCLGYLGTINVHLIHCFLLPSTLICQYQKC